MPDVNVQPGVTNVIITAQGKSIRIEPETAARASGRGSGGVRAIKLDANDSVIAADLVDKDGALMVLTSVGFGKRTDLSEYSPQGRGGSTSGLPNRPFPMRFPQRAPLLGARRTG